MLSLTSGKKITNEKVFKYQSAGDKTIEIVESAKLPQLAHHLRPIFGLVPLRLKGVNCVWISVILGTQGRRGIPVPIYLRRMAQ